MYEDNDEPLGQRLRVMTVMDVTPGRASDPKDGEKIAILLLAYKGELEQPIMLRMDDVQRLAKGFMRVWAHHAGGMAEEIVGRYFPDMGNSEST